MADKPFQTTGISLSDLKGNSGEVTDYDVGVFSSTDGELLFRDSFVNNILGKDTVSLRELYNRINGVFYEDGQLYFKDDTVSRAFSLQEIISSCQSWRKNLAAGSLWWAGRKSIDHSKCANIPRTPQNTNEKNVLWSIDKYLADITNTTICDNPDLFYNKTINEETGEWLWWDVQNLEIVVPPVEDPYKVAVIMAKLAYVVCNSAQTVVFRLYDVTTGRELTRTGVIQANAGKMSFPVTMNYFGPLTMSNNASKNYKSSGGKQLDCDTEEDCGCVDTSCIAGDPTCQIPNTNIISQSFAGNSHLIKVQFHVVDIDNNYWNRVFGIVDETGEYYTNSNIDVVMFDTTLNSRFTKQHGTVQLKNETEYQVVFDKALDTEDYAIQLSCSKNINVWWTNKKGYGFTIKSELPLYGQIDWSIVNINGR